MLTQGCGIGKGYGLDGRGSIPGEAKKFFSTSQRIDRVGVHLASYPVGSGEYFPKHIAACVAR
jgi:hypothetical protein